VNSDAAFCLISGMLTGFADSAEASNENIGVGFLKDAKALLKEYKKINEEHKRMIKRLEDAQELYNIKIDGLNLEVESLKRYLSNTGKRKWTDQIKNTVARKWPNRRKAG
jgi:hypothetical protein